PAQIKLVIASRDGLAGLDVAKSAKLPAVIVDRREFTSDESFSQRIFTLSDSANVDLVCLAGWLNLLMIPDRYLNRVMNIHPALLPDFGGKGMYGRRVHEVVLASGYNISGCTVHFVN